MGYVQERMIDFVLGSSWLVVSVPDELDLWMESPSFLPDFTHYLALYRILMIQHQKRLPLEATFLRKDGFVLVHRLQVEKSRFWGSLANRLVIVFQVSFSTSLSSRASLFCLDSSCGDG
jgi:hypothetical protein